MVKKVKVDTCDEIFEGVLETDQAESEFINRRYKQAKGFRVEKGVTP